jgi:hypothetical protein
MPRSCVYQFRHARVEQNIGQHGRVTTALHIPVGPILDDFRTKCQGGLSPAPPACCGGQFCVWNRTDGEMTSRYLFPVIGHKSGRR